MAIVELDIFSGRPNPVWTLDSRQRDELVDQLRAGSIALLDPDLAEGVLGYRGFIISLDESELELLGRADRRNARFRIRSGIAVNAEAIAEEWLLETTPHGMLVDVVAEEAESGIDQAVDRQMLNADGFSEVDILAACTVYGTSSTDFSFWNANSSDRLNNNCYNYAANLKTGTFAQPGRRSGAMYSSLTLSNISSACQRDGYRTVCDGSSLPVSLWIWPSVDYHFYRKTADVNGQSRWCHKPGSTNARNTDNSGNIITAPATCDRGNYNTGAVVLWGVADHVNVN